MPRGGVRPGAGRPRKPLAQHHLAGTWRVSRHGPRPLTAGPLVLPMPIAEDWHPTPQELAGLGDQGRRLLAATVRLYRLTELDGRQALLALRSLTLVEQMEAQVAAEGTQVAGEAHPLLPAIARERRLFLSAWSTLRLLEE